MEKIKRFGACEVGSVGYMKGERKIIVEKKLATYNGRTLYAVRSFSPSHNAWLFDGQFTGSSYIDVARNYFNDPNK